VDFEHAAAIFIAIEHPNGPFSVCIGRKDDGTKAAGAIIRAESDVGAENRACLSKKIFQVLPLRMKRQVANEQVPTQIGVL